MFHLDTTPVGGIPPSVENSSPQILFRPAIYLQRNEKFSL